MCTFLSCLLKFDDSCVAENEEDVREHREHYLKTGKASAPEAGKSGIVDLADADIDKLFSFQSSVSSNIVSF